MDVHGIAHGDAAAASVRDAYDHRHARVLLVRRESEPEVVALHAEPGEVFVAADDDLSPVGSGGDERIGARGKLCARRFHIDLFRLDAVGRVLVFTRDLRERRAGNVGNNALLDRDRVLRALAAVRHGDAALACRSHGRGVDAAVRQGDVLRAPVAHRGGHFQALIREFLSEIELRLDVARIQRDRRNGQLRLVPRPVFAAAVAGREGEREDGREDERESKQQSVQFFAFHPCFSFSFFLRHGSGGSLRTMTISSPPGDACAPHPLFDDHCNGKKKFRKSARPQLSFPAHYLSSAALFARKKKKSRRRQNRPRRAVRSAVRQLLPGAETGYGR